MMFLFSLLYAHWFWCKQMFFSSTLFFSSLCLSLDPKNSLPIEPKASPNFSLIILSGCVAQGRYSLQCGNKLITRKTSCQTPSTFQAGWLAAAVHEVYLTNTAPGCGFVIKSPRNLVLCQLLLDFLYLENTLGTRWSARVRLLSLWMHCRTHLALHFSLAAHAADLNFWFSPVHRKDFGPLDVGPLHDLESLL